MREAGCLQAVQTLGRELTEKRGVALASFVWDDGWDQPRSLWEPVKENLPNGFTKVLDLARRYHSTLGFWLSPFGGYDPARKERLAWGKEHGFEIGPQGFSLAGPKYYARFRQVCLDFMERDGANFFKFDGLARSLNETEAMFAQPRTTRPQAGLVHQHHHGHVAFALLVVVRRFDVAPGRRHGFRRGRLQARTMDHLSRPGNLSQRSEERPALSAQCHNDPRVRTRQGRLGALGSDPQEIRHELRSFFASGTCIQELYITPKLLTPENWDDLAACASWAAKNADVLVDTHWVGGNPKKGEVYGWASWSAQRHPGLAEPDGSPGQHRHRHWPGLRSCRLGRRSITC